MHPSSILCVFLVSVYQEFPSDFQMVWYSEWYHLMLDSSSYILEVDPLDYGNPCGNQIWTQKRTGASRWWSCAAFHTDKDPICQELAQISPLVELLITRPWILRDSFDSMAGVPEKQIIENTVEVCLNGFEWLQFHIIINITTVNFFISNPERKGECSWMFIRRMNVIWESQGKPLTP